MTLTFILKETKMFIGFVNSVFSECIETIRYGKQVKLEFYQGEDLETVPYDDEENL